MDPREPQKNETEKRRHASCEHVISNQLFAATQLAHDDALRPTSAKPIELPVHPHKAETRKRIGIGRLP